MKLNPLLLSTFHVNVCVGVYCRTKSARTSCTIPAWGVTTGTAQPGCFDEVLLTRASHFEKKLSCATHSEAEAICTTTIIDRMRRFISFSLVVQACFEKCFLGETS